MEEISLNINGEVYNCSVEKNRILLDVLRDGVAVTVKDEQAILVQAQRQADLLAERSQIINRREGHEWNRKYRW